VPTFLIDWTFEPSVLLGIGIVALLYWRGLRYSARRGMARRLTRGRVVSFVTGLLAVVVALESPIDLWSDRYLWVHMIQHEMLTMVAAPLLVLGSPALPLLRAIPLGLRRSLLGKATQQGWLRRLWQGIGHPLGSPGGAWVLFVGDFALWHLPPLYDLTLEQAPIHYLEHLLFLGTAILFWAQAIPSPPFGRRRSLTDRAVFLGTVVLLGNVLDVIFIAAPSPLYPYYAALPRPAGTISAMGDQSIAGGIMNGIDTTVLVSAILLLWRLPLRRERKAIRLDAAPTGTISAGDAPS